MKYPNVPVSTIGSLLTGMAVEGTMRLREEGTSWEGIQSPLGFLRRKKK